MGLFKYIWGKATRISIEQKVAWHLAAIYALIVAAMNYHSNEMQITEMVLKDSNITVDEIIPVQDLKKSALGKDQDFSDMANEIDNKPVVDTASKEIPKVLPQKLVESSTTQFQNELHDRMDDDPYEKPQKQKAKKAAGKAKTKNKASYKSANNSAYKNAKAGKGMHKLDDHVLFIDNSSDYGDLSDVDDRDIDRLMR